jgi:hypothetical protein
MSPKTGLEHKNLSLPEMEPRFIGHTPHCLVSVPIEMYRLSLQICKLKNIVKFHCDVLYCRFYKEGAI